MFLIAFGFYLLLAMLWSTVILWLIAWWWSARELKELTPLASNNFDFKLIEPKVSVLLPARNEADRILNECVESLLAQNYQNLEIIAINDRSTDKTGEILGHLASKNPRMQFIEGKELPAGWLGKPFALRQAFERAAGEWILSVDADLIFAPDAIKTAVYRAEQNKFDALCLIPFDVCESFWETVFLPVFGWFRMLKMPPTKVNDPLCKEALGVGSFFLMRRAALAKINGFESVKADVAEDLRLAELFKKANARFRLDYAPDLAQTRMYAGFGEIWTGFTKNLFAASNFSVSGTITGAGSIIVFGILPNVLAIMFGLAWLITAENSWLRLLLPAVLIYICQSIVFAAVNRAWSKPLMFALLAPLGLGLFAAILINSAICVVSGRGVIWKGRAIYRRNETKPLGSFLENK